MVLREVAFGPPTRIEELFRLAARSPHPFHPRDARQRIPLHRVRVLERFHRLEHREPVLILCPHCRSPKNAVIHAHY